MKKVLVVLVVTAVVILSSCTSARRGYGCPGQGSGMGFVGYK